MTNSANYRLPGIGTVPQDGSSGSATATIEQLPYTEPTEEMCECGHPRAQHDVIAARYCVATTAGSLERGCVCPG